MKKQRKQELKGSSQMHFPQCILNNITQLCRQACKCTDRTNEKPKDSMCGKRLTAWDKPPWGSCEDGGEVMGRWRRSVSAEGCPADPVIAPQSPHTQTQEGSFPPSCPPCRQSGHVQNHLHLLNPSRFSNP